MKILNRKDDGLKRTYNVLIQPESLEKAFDEELANTAQKIKISGFRPGKVPVEIVKRRYGDIVREEAQKNAIKSAAEDVIKQEAVILSFNYNTKVLKQEPDSGLEFELSFEIIPGIELKDMSDIEVTKYVVDLTEEQQLAPAERIRNLTPNWVPVDAGEVSKEDNLVYCDIVLEHRGKKVHTFKNEPVLIEKGSEKAQDYASHFLGLKVGDTKEFVIDYPKDAHDRHLAGKKITHFITVKDIRKRAEMTLDDLAKHLNMKDSNELKEWSKKIAQTDVDRRVNEVMKGDLLEKMTKYYDFQVPENMIRVEHQAVISQVAEEAQKLGKKMTPEIIAECKNIAIQRITLGFVVSEVARKNNIVVTQAEIARSISEIARNYPSNPQKVWDYYTQRENMSLIISPILEKKVTDFMLQNVVKVKEETCTLERLVEIDEEPFDFFKDDAAQAKGDEKKAKKAESAEKKAETKAKATKSEAEKSAEDDGKAKKSAKAPRKKTEK